MLYYLKKYQDLSRSLLKKIIENQNVKLIIKIILTIKKSKGEKIKLKFEDEKVTKKSNQKNKTKYYL